MELQHDAHKSLTLLYLPAKVYLLRIVDETLTLKNFTICLPELVGQIKKGSFLLRCRNYGDVVRHSIHYTEQMPFQQRWHPGMRQAVQLVERARDEVVHCER